MLKNQMVNPHGIQNSEMQEELIMDISFFIPEGVNHFEII